MADKAIDLDLSDAFHRLKRTVLLFSAALFVLGIADLSSIQTLHLPISGGDIKLPTVTVKWLLWGGGLYYLAGFVLEARSAIRLNSKAMRESSSVQLEQRFESLAQQLEGHSATIKGHIARIDQMIPSLEDHVRHRLTEVIANLRGVENPRTNPPNETPAQGAERLIQEFKAKEVADQALEKVVKSVGTEIEVTLSPSRLLEEMGQAANAARESHKDFTRFSRAIHGERQLSFYVWEIAGASGAFMVATAVNMPWSLIRAIMVVAWV